MRLWVRAALLNIGLAILCFGLVAPLWFSASRQLLAIPVAILILAGVNLLSRRVLRCPHCHKWAGRHARGYYTAFVGTACSYCGRDF